jgi:hypothetical protein
MNRKIFLSFGSRKASRLEKIQVHLVCEKNEGKKNITIPGKKIEFKHSTDFLYLIEVPSDAPLSTMSLNFSSSGLNKIKISPEELRLSENYECIFIFSDMIKSNGAQNNLFPTSQTKWLFDDLELFYSFLDKKVDDKEYYLESLFLHTYDHVKMTGILIDNELKLKFLEWFKAEKIPNIIILFLIFLDVNELFEYIKRDETLKNSLEKFLEMPLIGNKTLKRERAILMIYDVQIAC